MSNSIILSIKDFTIWYEPSYNRALTVRDGFVGFFSNPKRFFFSNKEKLVVFENISFTVKKGDIIGLLGANGVGKTTLCRYLAGIIKSDKIKITGEVRAIFETNIAFYNNLTGLENAIMLTEILYPECTQIQKKAILDEAIVFSELSEFINIPMNNYSRGMRAKLYLSLVTAKEADLLVLDEIFGGTDIFFAEKLETRIKQLIEKSGAVVMVSHNNDDIKKYCNRTIILSHKKILFDGDAEVGVKKYSDGQLNE